MPLFYRHRNSIPFIIKAMKISRWIRFRFIIHTWCSIRVDIFERYLYLSFLDHTNFFFYFFFIREKEVELKSCWNKSKVNRACIGWDERDRSKLTARLIISRIIFKLRDNRSIAIVKIHFILSFSRYYLLVLAFLLLRETNFTCSTILPLNFPTFPVTNLLSNYCTQPNIPRVP